MDEISYDLFTQERKRRSKKMASLKDAAERQAFSLAIDATLKSLNKDREKGLMAIQFYLDMIEQKRTAVGGIKSKSRLGVGGL